MFDSVIFAPWPRGVYLAQKLSEKGQTVAYVEILPRQKNPFGLFLDEYSKKEKEFLECLGFLFRQEGGFCLLSPEGVWPLQDMKYMNDRHSVLKNKLTEDSFKNFKNYWLSYLSLNLAGKVFEYNNSEFSNKSLNLFSDYFLFEASFKKIEQFQKDHPKITFYKVLLKDISFEEKQPRFFIQKELLKSKKYFCLGVHHFPIRKDENSCRPYWEWSACFFKAGFGDYEKMIPSHFISLKDIFLPWSHDNLLSVFHKNSQLEVWVRKPCGRKKESLFKGVKEHLETFFEGCDFSSIEKKSPKGPLIYGHESLKMKHSALKNRVYVESLNDFFQSDLVSEIRSEYELFKSL